MTPKTQSKLPRIMYDQTQFTSLWMIDKNGLWLCDKAYHDMRKISGYTPSEWIIYTQNKPVSFWFGAYDEEAINEEARVGFDNFTDKEFLDKFESAINKSYEETKALKDIFFSKFYKKEKEALEKEPIEVANFIQRIHDMSAFTMSYYFLTQPQRFYKFEEEIKQYLPNKELEHVSTNGRYLTYISQIQKFITDLASSIKEKNKTFNNFITENPEWSTKIDDIVKNIGFLNWGLLGGELADRTYIEKAVEELLNDDAKLVEEKRKTFELITHTDERNRIVANDKSRAVQVADIMGHSSVMRFDLQTFMLCTINYANIFIKAAQEKYKLTNDQLASYFYDEVVSLVKEGKLVDSEILDQRQKGFLKIHKGTTVDSYIAEKAHNEIKDLLEFRLSEINSTKEVRGTVASWPDKGTEKISARAFVLTTAFDIEEELRKFKPGDILVATQTHPNLVPQMKSAVAVVTDEGGITCHAAIVSRELRKPCIIGTKLSTKIFKTGDMLDLDLKLGTVKKV